MQAEVMVKTGGAALQPTDNDQVRQFCMALSPPPEGAPSRRTIAIPGPYRHGLVGGIPSFPGQDGRDNLLPCEESL